ncbi:MAG: phospho-N-acetylmuramoyl-pentapeptide-transferase [Clostridiales bacterium]|nr:phospho-N-acetylmuramoyl-pentapeptide-transferase [Clostridiales bacterium]
MKWAFAALAAFALTAAVMPLVIRLGKRLKIRQTILSYVDNHMGKSGTPTMGGIGIMLTLAVCCPLFMSKEDNKLMLVTLFVTLGYGIIGFIDDFIKVFFKQNKGLSPLQKIVFQLLIAVIVSVFAYNNALVGDTLYAPFTLKELHVGWLAVPLFTAVFLAFTNAVNLTDGLDGLAGKVSASYAFFFAVILGIAAFVAGDGQIEGEYGNLILYCAVLVGSLCGFLCYNCYPAKVFMGDTGALALGGGLGCLCIVSRLELVAPLIGILFVATAFSVILQVIAFKTTGKRVFLMAPMHHHFERKGVHENRIGTVYFAVTCAVGILCVALTLWLGI